MDALIAEVVVCSPSADQYFHGQSHWRRVAHWGVELATQTSEADALVCLLFALFHDSQRVNEDEDPGHGARGAVSARELIPRFIEIEDGQLELLVLACEEHTGGQTSSDPTIGCCWDADRLDLWRVGKRPRERYLSTAAAPGLIEAARALTEERHLPWRTDLVPSRRDG